MISEMLSALLYLPASFLVAGLSTSMWQVLSGLPYLFLALETQDIVKLVDQHDSQAQGILF